MCNLYSHMRSQAEIRAAARAMRDGLGNLPPMPGIYPDYSAPIVRTGPDGVRELALARWGLPTPPSMLSGSGRDPGVTNVRNAKSPHWRRWLGVENRCLVPFTSFSEPGRNPETGKSEPVWFSFGEERPLAFFAGIWVPQWTSTRKVKTGPETIDLFAFLTCQPNDEVGAIHPKAMPVILTDAEQFEYWMTAPAADALLLQRPLPDGALRIVARGGRQDPPAAPEPAAQGSLLL
ncbi:SOS response-associated peptidase [Roseococcus sp. YIM B11640]|uniref:SOS response-associated peptidase n=1 Tax=Roseococcus sp. YIM B11640 TaxID=3133973 RepID=UPI003C7EDA07